MLRIPPVNLQVNTMFGVFVTVLSLLGFANCAINILGNTTQPTTAAVVKPVPQFSSATVIGQVREHDIDETSGICASREQRDIVYVHNDKGDGPKIYAISSLNGDLMETLHVHHAHNYDWEDIACGPCDSQGGNCIYVGDIGDHSGDTPRDFIYKIREPTSFPAHDDDVDVDVEAKLQFRWEHFSEQPDAETLMVDTQGNIYVITKEHEGHGRVGFIPVSAWSSSSTFPISQTVPLRISSSKKDPSGGDISPDGREILIKSHTQVFYWYVNQGQNITDVLKSPPRSVSYHDEHNGEAVGWNDNGMGYYTLSEGHDQTLYYYARESS